MIDDIKGTTPEEMMKYWCPFLDEPCVVGGKSVQTSFGKESMKTYQCVMWKWISKDKGVCLQRVKKER